MRELSQSFRFPGATGEQLADLLRTAPLVGEGSIFGQRTVKSTSTDGTVRRAEGFEPIPLPLFRFDVELRQERNEAGPYVTIEFSQPNRRRPYLAGQFVWLLLDDGPAAVLREEINTEEALKLVSRPLDGAPGSLRRFLFFTGGHQRVMSDVANNLRGLLKHA